MISLFPSRPVAVDLFGFSIHWYGLLYLAGFLLAAYLLPRLQVYRKFHLSRDVWFSLLSWSVIGVILGGRLGYVFFYEPQYFLRHPFEVFSVWNGGMAFHGGLLGVLLVLWLWGRSQKMSLLTLGDIVVIPVAIGLALGRIGNFVNQELYGTLTTLPWGMAFDGVEGLRHPIQFYEMITNLIIAWVCFWNLRATANRVKSWGTNAALFLMLYSIARFCIEYVRDQQQYAWTHILWVSFTRAQLLTIPMFLAGVALFIGLKFRRR